MTRKPVDPAFQPVLDLIRRAFTLRPLVAAIVATGVISLIFMVFPGIDISVSTVFYSPGVGFPASGNGVLRSLRSVGLLSINLTAIVVVALTLARCLLPLSRLPAFLSRIQPHRLIFLVSTLALGPGLIANVILKDHWGRARPVQTLMFGGDHAFSLPWIVSASCQRNCSFISGEASGVFWLVALAFVVPSSARAGVAVVTLAWASVISLNRIAYGGHFLSDALIGWGLMLIVILALREIVLIRHALVIDARIDGWLGRASHR